ncbi:hypothetical protein LC087_16475 [Bacillus carboniphilus]|uniref:Uncharacterized protein n=1 Tax=Bacillus carboniphilus TaxID=86663 RepID=A0ABY9JSH3_9BACI|nr:hypothetical protein [Bacillus carboniphilus]WLR42297.1 hypothetical protein LC087_16475 [Bacillus carboniphilus]
MINNISLIKDIISNFSFSDVKFITGFHLQMFEEFGEKKAVLEIDFIIHSKTEQRFLSRFRFFDPQSIQFNSGGPYQQINLNIINIKEQGLEAITLEVIDYETGNLHFFCSGAEVLLVKETNYHLQ